MSISKNITSLTGATLAVAAGGLAVVNTPNMSIVAHADETHDQNVSTDPSVGDNPVQDPTKVSTITDAYNDIQGDTARDTNQMQHSSIGWEYQDPNQAAESWKAPDDTKVEPGTDNTQTDWNIATGTNGKSASDTSYDVTGDSSENKFNPGNINLYGVSAVSDKSASVRENWPAIERANMNYDDFIANYGSYWGPIYWGWYSHGYPYAIPYAYPGYGYGYVGGGATTVVNNNNNNNNNSSNNNGLNSLNGLNASLLAANGANGAGGSGNGGNNASGSNGQQQSGQQQSQSGSGNNSSSSSSSANSQTTVLPGGAVVPGVAGGYYGVGGLGVVTSNNNNNNNNNSNNNSNNLSSLSNLSNLASNNAGLANNGGNGGNGNNGNGLVNNGNNGNNGDLGNQNDKDLSAKKAPKAKKNTDALTPAKDKTANTAVSDNGAQTPSTDANATSTTGSGSSDGSGSGNGDVVGSGVVASTGSNAGSGSAVSDGGSGSSSSALPQTGNSLKLQKSSALGAGMIAMTLMAMGVSKKRQK